MGHTKLSGIITSGMVIQRGRDFHIWGYEDTLEEVQVIFENRTYSSSVSDGVFDIILPPHDEGVGFTIIVKGSEEIILKDILFGDVFMLAGQSNMELPIYRTRDKCADEIDAANYPYIRQFYLVPDYRLDESKEANLNEGKWIRAIPGEIEDMSAVGFFCAKNLQSKINVPIGLVLNAQGGSTLESWMSAESLKEFGNYDIIDKFQEDGSLQKCIADNQEALENWKNELLDKNYEEKAKQIPYIANKITLPGMFLASQGEGYIGSMWLYKKIYLVNEPEKDSFLYLGELMDSDITFINGVLVGRTEYVYPPRKYHFDGSILRKGENLIAVRLVIDHGNGGFLEEHPYYLRTGREIVDIKGTWYKVLENEAIRECDRVIMGQTIPTALYTSSIRPIRKLQFKGCLWYQGESNADDPYNLTKGSATPQGYDIMFKRMVELLRETFDQELPIVVVEMPDYVDPVNGMGEGWKVIQRMQLEAPLLVSNCESVRAKDLSEPYELHPQNKSELGKRMCEKVLSLMY